nr:zymogen granule membrane protein 16-like isoform X2 [Misgurnus anguillicaudatus]
MLHLCLILSAVCALGTTKPVPDTFSYSVGVGGGGGTEFSTAHEGLITGLRIWEYPGNYITGIQMKYDGNWTDLIGSGYGNQQDLVIYDKEFISQISGKYYGGYIYELMFVINTGRSFKVGTPAGNSFNFYPTVKGSQLRFLSGRHDGWAITSIGAHWAIVK